MKQTNFLISLVIPVYNEEKNIAPLMERIAPVVEKYTYDVIFVNDGSVDNTESEIKKIIEKNPAVKLISFSRNFSHQAALSAGYKIAKGDAVITLDADGQDPPEIIPEMIEKWLTGTKIIYAKRQTRSVDTAFKRGTAHWFYSFINFLSEIPIPEDVGDFRLLDKTVVEFLNNLPEHSKFLRGLVSWSGFSTDYVYFKREKRHAGKTHYTLSKMINFALDGITSFSTKPLRLSTYLGFFTSAFSIFVVAVKVLQHLFIPSSNWLPGWASLFFAVVFLGGVQLITIGIIGEYISKIFVEVQKRPPYVIKERVNV